MAVLEMAGRLVRFDVYKINHISPDWFKEEDLTWDL